MIMMKIVLTIAEMEVPGKMAEDQIEDGLEIAKGIQRLRNEDGKTVETVEEEAVLQEMMMIEEAVDIIVPDNPLVEDAVGKTTGKDIQKRQNAVGKTGGTVEEEAVLR